jgi:uncharacterized protein (DUF1501 family)
MTSRRQFLKLSGTTLVLLGWDPARTLAGLPSTGPARDGVLVVVFQRGAADGLHMVVPYRDKRYQSARGALALAEPGKAEGATQDLGHGFAFHPAMSSLHPLYESGRLAVVHAVGSPDPTRSHFDAQDYMETGTPGVKGTRDGWLSRALAALGSGAASPFAAVSLTSSLPRSLTGSKSAIALADFSRLATGRANGNLTERVERLYAADASAGFAAAGEEAFRTLDLFREKDPLSVPAREGVRYPRGRESQAFRQLAQLVKARLGIRVAFVESNGWDTHFGQGGATGQMANLLRGLSDSVAAFLADVGSDVPLTLLTVTEFGRTVEINGAGGTDHGHGSAMLVAGSGVSGGRVHGEWLGLDSKSLYEGRDLPVTTDFRDLCQEVANEALGLPETCELFPGHRHERPGVMSRKRS